ncbi:MAG: hypothetical protein LQ340_006778 [Diploschistes diacapsis]|nr:MAG: hypothetical protein LQ340_006778 [Diploschistes diacapsis]
MLSSTILYSTLLAAVALAQTPNASFNQTVVQQIIGEITATERSSWCTAQFSSCGSLCGGNPSSNQCDSTSLNYTCTCASNNSAPALQYYQPTMLSFICNRYLGDCLKNTAMSQSEQANCKATIVCGNSSANSVASAAPSSATPSATASSTASGSASKTSAASPSATQSKSAGDSVKISQEMTTGIFGAALFAVLGMAL